MKLNFSPVHNTPEDFIIDYPYDNMAKGKCRPNNQLAELADKKSKDVVF